LLLQASWLIEIEKVLKIIMASIERSSRRTSSVKKKTKPSSSKVIEVERIIMRDGFSYFPIAND
jgi:hypothetical protein